MTRPVRSGTVLLAVVLAACGGAAAPGSSSETGPSGQSSTSGGPGGSGGGLTLPSFPAETSSPAPEDSGATIRLVNAWGTEDGVGPSVELRTSGSDGVTLLTVAPGEVSDFVAVPKARFGDSVEHLTVVEAGSEPGTSGLGPGEVQAGDRVTSIIYGYPSQGAIIMGIDSAWEVGEPFYGQPWPPEVPATDATLAVYPGPLLYVTEAASELSSLTLATGDGECLIDPMFGDTINGFGGNGVEYAILPSDTTELRATFANAACEAVPTDAATISVAAAPGARVGLVPWAPSGEAEYIVLEMTSGG